jgi:hypothetical protein
VKSPPEYKPVRNALWAVYIAAASFLAVCLGVAALRGAQARMGSAPEPAPASSVDAAAVAACMGELQALYVELNERLNSAVGTLPAKRSSAEWEDWSPQWRARRLAVGARCRLEERDVPAARPLVEPYQRLGQLHRHYTTLAVQFSKETGPHSDALFEAMKQAREAVAAQGR